MVAAGGFYLSKFVPTWNPLATPMFMGYIATYAADHQYELCAKAIPLYFWHGIGNSHYTAPGIHYINVSGIKGSTQLTEKMKPTPST